MTSVDSNFNFLCGRPHGALPSPPSTCVHLSLTPCLLRMDVVNWWPLIQYYKVLFKRLQQQIKQIETVLFSLKCVHLEVVTCIALCHLIRGRAWVMLTETEEVSKDFSIDRKQRSGEGDWPSLWFLRFGRLRVEAHQPKSHHFTLTLKRSIFIM